jgi:hypothetical protein
MATTKITQSEKVLRFLADLTVKMGGGKISVRQAVQAVNRFADSLPNDQVAEARAFMTDFVFAAKESVQKEEPPHKPFCEMTLGELATFAAENREAGRPKDEEADEWYWIRRKEKYGPPKIHWRSDPRELGLPKMDFNPEDVPWQEREPWRTIKTYLPPAMIDTDEKERSVAWRIGFLIGYGAEKAAAAAIREYGLVGGAWLVGLFAWAYEYQKRNS